MNQISLLSVDGVRISYYLPNRTIRAVNGVSFEIMSNEVFGLVGESGSGKSTLSMGILRLISPPGKVDTGTIYYKDQNILLLGDEEFRQLRWKDLAYIPQGSMGALNPVMKVRDQFYDVEWDHNGSKSRKEIDERIMDLLTKVHLAANILDKYPHELSGGMKQRVCIALSMYLEPKIIIADEPTSALDVITQRAVIATLLEARQRLKASMILIGHDMAIQAQVADRIAIMYNGYIVEIGKTKDIFNDPLHLYSQHLISSVPSIQHKQNIHEIALAGLKRSTSLRQTDIPKLTEVKPGHFAAI